LLLQSAFRSGLGQSDEISIATYRHLAHIGTTGFIEHLAFHQDDRKVPSKLSIPTTKKKHKKTIIVKLKTIYH